MSPGMEKMVVDDDDGLPWWLMMTNRSKNSEY